jgi:type IV secretory pathway component VirB8
MKILNKVFWFCRVFLLAFMFAVCMVIGIAPIIPKRKEEIEIKIETETNNDNVEEKTSRIKNWDNQKYN